MDLADFRDQIDEIDQELMALFRRRMETVEQIAAYKEQHGLPVYDPQREEEKRTALLAQLPPALRDDAGALLTCLFTLSKAHQSRHAAMPRRCGLLGRRLAHSYSPAIHARLGSYEYRLFQREPEELEAFLREGAGDGLNVTIPYKQAAAACCDRLSPGACMETTSTLGALGKPFVGCMWAAPERRPWFWAPAGPPSQCRQYSGSWGPRWW